LLEKRHNLLEEKPTEPKKHFFFPKTTFFTKNSFKKKCFLGSVVFLPTNYVIISFEPKIEI
jgi:hypothetical protein